MALQTIGGQGLWMGLPWMGWGATPALSSTLVIDATGEKIGVCGRMWNKDRATKTIARVHFRFGAVTKSSGSALTVSLQDPSTATSPMAPDEATDQFRAIANADANFAANTWYTSGLVTSDGTDGGTKRTVAFGERIAVVLEYDGAGRLGADSVVMSSVTQLSGAMNGFSTSLKTGGSWGIQTVNGGVLFEFDDGTCGTIDGCFPISAINAHAFKQDTAIADEHALEFSFPFPCAVDGAGCLATITAITADFSVILYDGVTPLASGTVTVDGAEAGAATGRMLIATFGGNVLLDANTPYRLAIKPTQTTTNVSVYSVDVANASHFQAHPGGVDWQYTNRLDNGSWAAPTATRRLMAGLRVSALDDGIAPSITFPPASKVYAGTDRGDGVLGTLHASNIATAAGAGSNLAAGDLRSGITVDDVTGTLTPGGGGGGGGSYTFIG